MTTVNRQESTAQVKAVETKHLHGCLNDKKTIYEKGEIVKRDSRYVDNDNELNNDKFLCFFSPI